METTKNVQLYEDTRVLLNKAKAKIISEDPERLKVTDDTTIKVALSYFLGVKNAKRK